MHQKTLTQFLIHHLQDHPQRNDLVLIMSDLSTIGKKLSWMVNHAGIEDILGATGKTNIQDEQVQKLDVYANELCKEFLKRTGHFAAMASEEEESTVDMGTFGENSDYIICFDPLDGSSNIDVNVSIGTIFSVYPKLKNINRLDEEQFLQKGSEQVLAGYILYGSSTVIVFSFGEGVYECTLDATIGDFVISRENVRIPDTHTVYSVNEKNVPNMTEIDAKFVASLREIPGITARYIGSLVADVHRNMLKGGIFMYPSVASVEHGIFKPKLRLLFEANPMAFLYKQMGGLAVSEKKAILDIKPTQIHERVSLTIGNHDLIERYQSLFN